MYYVIFYDNWCSTVPQLWVDLQNKTFYWPPKDINPTTATIKKSHPNNKWEKKIYRRIIGPYSNYYITIYFLL